MTVAINISKTDKWWLQENGQYQKNIKDFNRLFLPPYFNFVKRDEEKTH